MSKTNCIIRFQFSICLPNNDLIKKSAFDVTQFENQTVPKIIFDSYNLESLNVFALLFQTGYLTISEIDSQELFLEYTLNYPNLEVKQAFITYLFESFTQNRLEEIQPAAKKLHRYLPDRKSVV